LGLLRKISSGYELYQNKIAPLKNQWGIAIETKTNETPQLRDSNFIYWPKVSAITDHRT